MYNTEYYILGTFHGIYRNYEYQVSFAVVLEQRLVYSYSYMVPVLVSPEWLQHQTLSSDIADLAD